MIISALSSLRSYAQDVQEAPDVVKNAMTVLAKTNHTMARLQFIMMHITQQPDFYEKYTAYAEHDTLNNILQTTRYACNELNNVLFSCTKKSTQEHFSARDRIIVQLNKHKFEPLIVQLETCMSTMNLSIEAIKT